MIIKTYGLYDSVAKEYVRTFISKDDAVAERSWKNIVRDPSFDSIAGKDYVVVHLYDMDSATGIVSNNDCKTICAMATFMAEYEAEKLQQKLIDAEKGEQDGEQTAW